ncbi:tyrosine-type recombinase/integrase [Testudinibacter sp. P80/BLE/0925]|uniref:tyrosine-type recombinase/integrase n=1 Tax=Testudinibacter sp. TW-1 TaxID=3417757 RepID=UPI003D35BB95
MAKVVAPLTNTQVAQAKPQEKDYRLFDGGGLSLLVKSNSSKLWRFEYKKPFTKKAALLSLGAYPEISIAQARQKREEFRILLAQGIDPQIKREQEKLEKQLELANTLQAMAEKWKAKKLQEVAELTINKNYRRLEKHLFPYVANCPISDITAPLMVSALQPLAKQGKSETLHRIIGMLNEILDFAVNGGLLTYNPCTNIRKMFAKHTKTNNPAIHHDEIPQFLNDLQNSNIEPKTRFLVMWQMLTMVRSNEAVCAEWAEIDLEKALWTIPAEKMKKTRHSLKNPHIVPLSPQALTILKKMQPMTGHLKYVFASSLTSGKPMNKETVNTTIKRMGYSGKQTAHGLRRLASTYLNEMGEPRDYVDACLAHHIQGVSGVYNKATYFNQRIGIMNRWGAFIEECQKKAVTL